jgi:hypothetical protein
MVKTIAYSLYKKSYSEFRAENYNARKKTIDVDLPDYTKPRFPSEWRRDGSRFFTPNGCTIAVWNTGLAENFLVEHGTSNFNHQSKTVPAGLYAREKVIEYVASFD